MVADHTGAPGVAVADKALFERGTRKLAEALRQHDITKPKGALNTYGTAVLINILNEAGGLPTRNFSSGRFEGAAKIAGEAIFEGNKARLGKEQDRVPEFMLQEPLPPHNQVFDVPESALDAVYGEL